MRSICMSNSWQNEKSALYNNNHKFISNKIGNRYDDTWREKDGRIDRLYRTYVLYVVLLETSCCSWQRSRSVVLKATKQRRGQRVKNASSIDRGAFIYTPCSRVVRKRINREAPSWHTFSSLSLSLYPSPSLRHFFFHLFLRALLCHLFRQRLTWNLFIPIARDKSHKSFVFLKAEGSFDEDSVQ